MFELTFSSSSLCPLSSYGHQKRVLDQLLAVGSTIRLVLREFTAHSTTSAASKFDWDNCANDDFIYF